MADIRGFGAAGGKRRPIRVPAKYIRSTDPAAAKRDAEAYAEECERYCRRLEGTHEPEDVLHALRLGAISQEQADGLQHGQYVPPSAAKSEPLTIRAAALSHPSSQRDGLTLQKRYLAHVDQFSAYAGVTHLSAVRIEHVTGWVAKMRGDGWAWDTRRHALMYLRRAMLMGGRFSIPNVIAGLKIDERERASLVVRAWSLPQLAAAIIAADTPRERAVLALGGCMGLRPTEIVRIDLAEDLEGDLLHIGRRKAKNNPSVRTLVVPKTVLGWLREAIGKRKRGPLIESDIRRRGRPLTVSGLGQAMRPALRAAKGRPKLIAKELRKTFTTWSAPLIEARDLERYLGHASALHSQVTVRHYLAHHLAEQLRPAAKILDAAIAEAIADARPRRRAKKPA